MHQKKLPLTDEQIQWAHQQTRPLLVTDVTDVTGVTDESRFSEPTSRLGTHL